MKKLVLVVSALLLTVWSLGALADGIAVVDMEKVFKTSSKIKNINSALQKRFAVREKEINKTGESLQQDIKDYDKNKAVMDEKKLADLRAKIDEKQASFQAMQTKFQQDLFAEQNKEMATFMDDVKASVKTVAEKKKLSLVLPKNAVLYSEVSADITNDVVAGLK
jgi:outer membrane protein